MTYDAELNLLVCEHATSSARPRAAGREARGAGLAFRGDASSTARTTSACKSDGSIYFSDPWYGRMPVYGVERPRQLGLQGVYRVPPGGGEPAAPGRPLPVRAAERAVLLARRGPALRQRHRAGAMIRVFDVQPDGSLGTGRVFASGIVTRLRARRARRDEVRRARATSGSRRPAALWVYRSRRAS